MTGNFPLKYPLVPDRKSISGRVPLPDGRALQSLSVIDAIYLGTYIARWEMIGLSLTVREAIDYIAGVET